jgi:hypothetical protein
MARSAYSAVRDSIVGYLDKHVQFMLGSARLSIRRSSSRASVVKNLANPPKEFLFRKWLLNEIRR